MNLFETETWRAFFPNFIAVVASIVLTFGTDRAIQEYNHRQDIREVIAVLKADARESGKPPTTAAASALPPTASYGPATATTRCRPKCSENS